jgi:hypothetical protein
MKIRRKRTMGRKKRSLRRNVNNKIKRKFKWRREM